MRIIETKEEEVDGMKIRKEDRTCSDRYADKVLQACVAKEKNVAGLNPRLMWAWTRREMRRGSDIDSA